jgi:hypothetical protein
MYLCQASFALALGEWRSRTVQPGDLSILLVVCGRSGKAVFQALAAFTARFAWLRLIHVARVAERMGHACVARSSISPPAVENNSQHELFDQTQLCNRATHAG